MSKEIKVGHWDTTEILETREDIDVYLDVAFESNDPKQITKALGNAARVHGILDVAKKTG